MNPSRKAERSRIEQSANGPGVEMADYFTSSFSRQKKVISPLCGLLQGNFSCLTSSSLHNSNSFNSSSGESNPLNDERLIPRGYFTNGKLPLLCSALFSSLPLPAMHSALHAPSLHDELLLSPLSYKTVVIYLS